MIYYSLLVYKPLLQQIVHFLVSMIFNAQSKNMKILCKNFFYLNFIYCFNKFCCHNSHSYMFRKLFIDFIPFFNILLIHNFLINQFFYDFCSSTLRLTSKNFTSIFLIFFQILNRCTC
uniref:Transmembrane protein n=1 Tax=Siphoviridae sp. ctXZx16 TaxID=2826371 RepID=A0A8S5MKY2_9CAUD|nr:MAG TPA: hypothetical protein [Siphoviridae sp. ctXZx16]